LYYLRQWKFYSTGREDIYGDNAIVLERICSEAKMKPQASLIKLFFALISLYFSKLACLSMLITGKQFHPSLRCKVCRPTQVLHITRTIISSSTRVTNITKVPHLEYDPHQFPKSYIMNKLIKNYIKLNYSCTVKPLQWQLYN